MAESRRAGRRRTPLSTLMIALLLVGAWAVEQWGPGLIPGNWSFGASGRTCRLDTVLDGDSLRLTCQGERVEVRLHCIDAPEHKQRPWSDRSRDSLRQLATRHLELVPIDKDRFGRTVGDVYSVGSTSRSLLNLEQVRSGNAAVYARYCEDKRFFRAEREAREAKRGIWSRKGEHQTPWIFRHRKR